MMMMCLRMMMMMLLRPEDDARRSMGVDEFVLRARWSTCARTSVDLSASSREARHLVRHAEGYHNLRSALTFDSTYNSSINFDARLTPRGEGSARRWRER